MQQDFLNYLLEKESSIESNIISDAQASAKQRLNFYANAYKLRLKEAIETDYEQLHAYLGDELFDRLMEEYISLNPSHQYNLRHYSTKIPSLLAENEPWSQIPELVEIAKIEKAFCDSFDAEDCDIASVNHLSQIDPKSWPTLKIRFHDSMKLLKMNFNSFPIWQALSDEQTPPPAKEEPGSWIIWRKDLVSSYCSLTKAEVTAIETMMSGGDFSTLCEALLDYYDEESTPQQAVALLQEWLSNEMVCELN